MAAAHTQESTRKRAIFVCVLLTVGLSGMFYVVATTTVDAAENYFKCQNLYKRVAHCKTYPQVKNLKDKTKTTQSRKELQSTSSVSSYNTNINNNSKDYMNSNNNGSLNNSNTNHMTMSNNANMLQMQSSQYDDCINSIGDCAFANNQMYAAGTESGGTDAEVKSSNESKLARKIKRIKTEEATDR